MDLIETIRFFGLAIIVLQIIIIYKLKRMENRMAKTQAELVVELQAVLEQQKKTTTEIQAVQTSVNTLKEKITELEEIINAGGTGGEASQELVDAVQAVKDQAQVVDDEIPDVPVIPEG